jgi:hypothetical protein
MIPVRKFLVAGPLRTVVIILALVISANAQDFPEKAASATDRTSSAISEEAPKKPKGIVADKAFWIVSGTMAGVYVADEVSTAGWIHRCPNCYEMGYFGHNGRSLPTIAAEQAAFDVGALFLAYEWKKHIHNRVLNGLWIAYPSFQISNHIQATIHNQSLGRN